MTQYLNVKEAFEKNNDKITFQPVTREARKKFSIYDAQEKKFYGEDFEFEMDGRDEPVKVNKFLKLTEEEKKRYRWVVRESRDIIYDGEEQVYDMPPSVNKQLVKAMETVENLGNNPLGLTYTVVRKKKGDRPIDVEYEVIVGEKVSGVVEDVPDISLDDETDDSVELSPKERQYVEAIKKKYPDFADKPTDVWSNLLKSKLSLDISRATAIAEQYLS